MNADIEKNETEVASFEKKGIEIKVILKNIIHKDPYDIKYNPSIHLRTGDVDVRVSNIYKDEKHGWIYNTSDVDGELCKLFGLPFRKFGYVKFLHPSAEQAKKEIVELEIEEKQQRMKKIKRDFDKLNKDSEITLVWSSRGNHVQVSESAAGKSDYFKKALDAIKKLSYTKDIKEILNMKPNDVDWGDYNLDEIYEMTFGEFQNVAEKAFAYVEKLEEEKKVKKAQYEADVQQKFEQAKVTGQPIELERWMEPCNDYGLECSTDILIRYAMPDGTINIKRTHTY